MVHSSGERRVWRPEDVLDLYEEPYDPQRPTVCFDETSTQLIGESRIPLPAGRDGESGSTMSTGATAPVWGGSRAT